MDRDHQNLPEALEKRLRATLKREDPADGFEQRVLARIRAQEAETGSRSSRNRFAAGSLALAASMLLTLGSAHYFQRQQAAEEARQAQLEGEHAKEQLMLALRIASEKTRFAREWV